MRRSTTTTRRSSSRAASVGANGASTPARAGPRQSSSAAAGIILLVLEESGEVELTRLDPQPVPVSDRLDALRSEQFPQSVDGDLKSVLSARGRVLSPEPVDQCVAPDDLVRM